MTAKNVLINFEGPQGCIVSNRIMVDGCKVGFCYRVETDSNFPDSGWRFFAGDESEEYMANTYNMEIYPLETLANHDSSILTIVNTPSNCAFEKIGNEFIEIIDFF